MGDYWTNAVRHPEDTGVGHISRELTLAQLTGAPAAGMPIGALESGCVPYHCQVTIITAFNAVTTNTLDVGTVADPDGYATAAVSLAGAAGFKGNMVGALTGIPLAADTIVYAVYGQTGTAATTGKAIVTLYFRNKREVTGTAWPQNI